MTMSAGRRPAKKKRTNKSYKPDVDMFSMTHAFSTSRPAVLLSMLFATGVRTMPLNGAV
jgi:hypothetical protein